MKSTKKLLFSLLAMVAATALIAGCTDDKGGGGNSKAKGTPIPARAEVKTSPMTTFKFGDKEAKVYAIQNIDIKGLGAYRLAAAKNTVYMLAQSNPGILKIVGNNKKTVIKVDIENEKVQNISLIGEWLNDSSLQANEKGAMWFEHYNKAAKENLYAFYDGKETKHSIRSPFGATTYAFKTGTTDIYHKGGMGGIEHAKYENGTIKELEPVIKRDVLEKAIGDNFTGIIKAVDDKNYYLIRTVKKEKVDIPTMSVFKHDGTLLYTIEGITDLPRDWAVTTNYIMHAGSKGDVVIYNKDDGKLIETTKIPGTRIFKLSTATGNDVYATDDRNKKLLRIDL